MSNAVYLTPGDDNSLRVTNAINKNAALLDLNNSNSRDYRFVTEGVFASEDYGSVA